MMSRSCNPRVISSRNVDLKALLLTQGVIVATCLSTFVGARQLAPEPSASSPSASSSSSSLCSRAIANTLWGSAFAFFSLAADLLPTVRTSTSLSYERRIWPISLLVTTPMYPLTAIWGVSSNLSRALRFRQIVKSSINTELAADATSMFNKFRRYVDDILVIMFGIKQPRGFLKNTRMAANTRIVLGISDSSTLPPTHLKKSDPPLKEENVADALTLGHKTAENSCLMELNAAGKLALLESSILPDYKQLRFLDGRSGIATLIICVQATGYVTSIVYRAIHHLPVSPIEAIGFSFSMLVIVHSLVYSLGAFSQCPLVISLNPTQEQQMIDKCKSIRWSNADELMCRKTAALGTVVVGSVVVAFTILVEWEVLKISLLDAIGPILFLLSLITQSLPLIIWREGLTSGRMLSATLVGSSWMISLGGIVVSIVATILNWHTNKFDIRTPSVIHNLPFLG
ncbi:unnamed protein product [Sphagnum jensenii]|uniref:Uncharacterized protein n=1 Tax=Sphagnum jensenii TaxID=128206 RepID=A0ABP1BB46_9BRYO